MLGVCYGNYVDTHMFVDCFRYKISARPRAAHPRHFPGRTWYLAALIFSFSSWTGSLLAQEENVPEAETAIVFEQAAEPPVDESAVIDEETITGEPELPVADEQPTNRIEDFFELEDAVNYYLDAIEDAEAAHSAYSITLAELFQGLGNSMLDQENYEDAKEAFQQSTQIVRVNYGLDSPAQSEYLFQIANIEQLIGDHASVDELLDTIYTVNANFYGELDPGMLPVLNKLLAWYEFNRPTNRGIVYYSDIERTTLLSLQIARISELDKGLGHPETTKYYRDIGQNQWNTIKFLLSQGMPAKSSISMTRESRPGSTNSGGIFVSAHIRAGKEAFIKVAESVAKDPQRSVLEAAEALAQFGDWSLISGKRNAATEAYEEAYQLIVQSSGSTALADKYFSRPVPVRFMNRQLIPVVEDPTGVILNLNQAPRSLPRTPVTQYQMFADSAMREKFYPVSENETADMEPTALATLEDSEAAVTDTQILADSMNDNATLQDEPQVITIAMTITDTGKPVKVKVINQPPQLNDNYVRNLQRAFTRTRFRPRLENGAPVKTEDFTWNIPLAKSEGAP